MSKSLQQIEKDLADLEKQVSQFAVIFYEKYQKYLDLLSQTVRQQVILASYQICTQIHPKSFLELSLGVRQSLQEQIRHYANDVHKKIRAVLDSTLDLKIEVQTVEEALEKMTIPDELSIWAQNIEQKIKKILDNYSNLLNQCFMEIGVFPDNLPATFLEMAIEAQEEGSAITGATNLLQVLIGAEEVEQDDLMVKETKINSVIIVHLKLAELEFGNPALGIERQQVRYLVDDRLKSLSQIYQQKQRELAIVQAQTAWRSIWYDS